MSKPTTIKELRDIDRELAKICKEQDELTQAGLDAKKEIEAIHAEHNHAQMTDKVQAVEDRIKALHEKKSQVIGKLEETITAFAEEHQEAILAAYGRGKTAQFEHGTIKYQGQKAIVEIEEGREKDVIEQLRSLGHGQLVAVKESVDKNGLSRLPGVVEKVAGVTLTERPDKVVVTAEHKAA